MGDLRGFILRGGDRFKSAQEMNELIIQRWNETISVSDHVYHLGDVAMNPGFLSLIPALNGHKRLVRGNHDIFKTKKYIEGA